MVLTEAIKSARTEHVVYFLLAAYVETLDYFDPLRSSLPQSVKKLPIEGLADVVERLGAVRAAILERTPCETRARLLFMEAVDVFTAASQRLRTLQQSGREFERAPHGLLSEEPRIRKAARWTGENAGRESDDRNETSATRNRDRSSNVGLECGGAQPARPRKALPARLAHD